MRRRGEDYWRKAIAEQTASGVSAARFCRKRRLPRGTFLRWRRRLGDDGTGGGGLVEIRKRPEVAKDREDTSLEICLGADIRIVVPTGANLELVGCLVAAIRRAV